MGPSKFTESTGRNTMLENELNLGQVNDPGKDVDVAQKRDLVRIFFAAVRIAAYSGNFWTTHSTNKV